MNTTGKMQDLKFATVSLVILKLNVHLGISKGFEVISVLELF